MAAQRSPRPTRRARHLLGASLTLVGLATVIPAATATTAGLGYDASTEFGSLSVITRITGAQAAWAAGVTGAGVDVAVIDTGVTPVQGLDLPGKVVNGPDLSLDSQTPNLVYLDGFGHGTHMAGIIAGSDVPAGTSASGCATCLTNSAYSDTTRFVGIAPEARIVNVKVGASDGAVDVSQVIAGIDWVVQHRSDNGLNIRVLNLSFGTQSLASPDMDVLAYAAEQAWNAGIVVVAAAGNDGDTIKKGLADPAYDTRLLAVGAQDPMGTLAAADDTVPSFAQHGTSQRPVDVVAPGVHVLGLRVPGSYVDTVIGTGIVGDRFQRGSGTSEAAAVVSGLSALVLSKFPNATADQVKAYLTSNAQPLSQSGKKAAPSYGSGGAYVGGLAGGVALPAQPPANRNPSLGTGTLDQARGGVASLTDGATGLTGEQDVMGMRWDSAALATAEAAGTSWSDGVWNGSTWTGARWSGGTWDGARWSSVSWEGARWSGSDWTGARWSGARWSDMAWDGARWSGTTWSGARWSSTDWTGARWSGARWSTASLS